MENLLPLILWARCTGIAVIPRPGTTKTSYIAIRDIAEMARLVVVSPPRPASVKIKDHSVAEDVEVQGPPS